MYKMSQHTDGLQDVDETPDFTEDSDTNPNTTESSVVGEPANFDGRKRRSEATQLRRSVFGKKHDALGESKVINITCLYLLDCTNIFAMHRKMIRFADFDTC